MASLVRSPNASSSSARRRRLTLTSSRPASRLPSRAQPPPTSRRSRGSDPGTPRRSAPAASSSSSPSPESSARNARSTAASVPASFRWVSVRPLPTCTSIWATRPGSTPLVLDKWVPLLVLPAELGLDGVLLGRPEGSLDLACEVHSPSPKCGRTYRFSKCIRKPHQKDQTDKKC
jgi:hypothetical protein